MDVSIVEIKNVIDASLKIASIGADSYSVPLMAQKAFTTALKLHKIDNRAANLIKQEALSLGAEAAVNQNISRFIKGKSDVLLTANYKQLRALLSKLSVQPFGLNALSEKMGLALSNYEKKEFKFKSGSKIIELGSRPKVMGIVNVTPDSFSDGGLLGSSEEAVEHALHLINEGADIIDIGGESSRPGAIPVQLKIEKERVLPVIKKLAKKTKVPISIDTLKPEVARAALDNGAGIINDISGLRFENGKMAKLAAKYRVPVIIMHMQGMPRNMQKKPVYKDVICDISDFFSERVSFALNAGMKTDQIILDPGIGFGKTLEHNIEILKRLREFKVLGYPLSIGTSRKSFIGKILNIENPLDRIEGSLTTSFWSALNGAKILRVHDVKETVRALKIAEVLQ
ncbi:MAG: dihydropteroate synthase [Elusimicrobia bacterium]|nr:dihydropteroate synthase [Elusimicrobiota bacterium]